MVRSSFLRLLLASFALGAVPIFACSADRQALPPPDAGTDSPPGPGFNEDSGDAGTPPLGETRDPVTCEEAKTSKSYVGCDYWPTVTPNMVWSIFDYAVVVANTGAKEATITVTGPNGLNKQVLVPAGELRKVYLPWVPALKGPDIDACSSKIPRLEGSVIVPNGAYHLVSSSPVIVYQFNALEYKGEGGESEDGGVKDWSQCPANLCATVTYPCLSYTNDASLLLPSTAMTNNYRVTSFPGYPGGEAVGTSTAISITATQPNTKITVTLSATASVMKSVVADPDAGADGGADGGVDAGSPGPPVPATPLGGLATITLENAGDVAMLVSDRSADLSGSLVQSDKPVQVVASDPCTSIPFGKQACDHLEETVLPVETLGKHYVVTTPTGPKGAPVAHVVRLFGNQDDTKLKYKPQKPSGCPLELNEGQVVDCAVVNESFEVTGDKEFAVTTFLLGASQYSSPGDELLGDPSQSNIGSVEQFRTKYIFLAPNDYPIQWADITAPEDAEIMLDGKPLDVTWTKVGGASFGLHRVDLTKSGKDGTHTLTAKKPVGVQVIGYGNATSFQYPAGLNLNIIAPSPPPK
jgi:hypothetical protein